MLKNQFYVLDDLTSIVVSYSESIRPWTISKEYQGTVRYITTTKCLTVQTIQCNDQEHVKYCANKIVAEMQAEYLDNKGSKL